MKLPESSLKQLFLDARTVNLFTDMPVPAALLQELHALASMGPTSTNCQPMRLVFLVTPAARARLLSALSAGNLEKTRVAPVTVIVAYDAQFFELMPRIWHNPASRNTFAENPALAHATAFRNGSLQGGYLILAARALGLDCGPMSGFDLEKVNAEFFADGRWRANFLCNLGYGKREGLRERQPRLSFDEACQVL